MIYVIHWFVNILTLGLVSIATITTTTYHVDEPISELNNLTLNDVFDTNNLIDYNGINGYNGGSIDSLINNVFTITQEDGNDFFRTGYLIPTVNSGHKVYSSASFKLISGSNVTATITNAYGNTGPLTNPNDSSTLNTSDFIRLSVLSTALSSDQYFSSQNLLFYFRTNKVSSYNVKDVYYIDLTDLGIDNLTQAELDDWYEIWIQANENNGIYIESTSHLNNNIHLVDVSVMVISFAFWLWLYKFLKGVIL